MKIHVYKIPREDGSLDTISMDHWLIDESSPEWARKAASFLNSDKKNHPLREKVEGLVADFMIAFGPDGRTDGYDMITALFFVLLEHPDFADKLCVKK